MDIFNQLAAKLVAKSAIFYMTLGLVVTAFLYFLFKPDLAQVKALASLSKLPFFFFIFLNTACCKIFHADNYDKVMPPKAMRGRTLGILNVDNQFYELINSDMNFSRKIAGYFYAVSKVITCFSLTALLVTAVYLINLVGFK